MESDANDDRGEDDHLTKEQIRDVVENPDDVYRGTNYDHSTIPQTAYDGIKLSTAYERADNPREFVKRFVESNQLDKIYPKDD